MVVQRKRPAEKNDYGRGAFSGYAEYRYGTGWRSSRDMAVPVNDMSESIEYWHPRKPHKAKLDKGARERVIKMLTDLLRDWENSAWEQEAETYYALRSAFLAMGFHYQLADDEAADLVRLAYSRLGQGIERRPKWEEGQHYITTSHTVCNWCAGPLDPFAVEIGNRFCCKEHADKAAKLRDYEHRFRETEIGKNANDMLKRADLPIRQECARPGCKEHFRPKHGYDKYCTEACNHKVKEARKKVRRHEAMAEQPERTCENAKCGKGFRPKRIAREQDRFCCNACRRAEEYQRLKGKTAR